MSVCQPVFHMARIFLSLPQQRPMERCHGHGECNAVLFCLGCATSPGPMLLKCQRCSWASLQTTGRHTGTGLGMAASRGNEATGIPDTEHDSDTPISPNTNMQQCTSTPGEERNLAPARRLAVSSPRPALVRSNRSHPPPGGTIVIEFSSRKAIKI